MRLTAFKRRARRALVPMLWSTGALCVLHRVVNRDTLTVFGLHRVLAPDDPRARLAMPTWTVSTQLFAELLEFLGRHYRMVTVDEVCDALSGGRPLPSRAALLTFDDGWADTVDTALPMLRAAGVPAVVFVVSGQVGARISFWEPEWHAALTAATAGDRKRAFESLTSMPAPSDAGDCLIGAVLDSLQSRPLPERFRLLDELLGGAVDQGGCAIVQASQFGEMIAGGLSIGAHGVTHEPLAASPNADGEIRESLATLRALVAPWGGTVRTFSYPHGSYDARLTGVAAAHGAELQFTSDQVLTPLRNGIPTGAVMGRVWAGPLVANPGGGLDRAEAAWKYFRSYDAAVPTSAGPGGNGA